MTERAAAEEAPATIRLDRFLWFARLTKTRTLAQELAEAGHLRLNGRRIDRAHCPVRIGDVVGLPWHGGAVRILKVLSLPTRRGPASEARALYEEVEEGTRTR